MTAARVALALLLAPLSLQAATTPLDQALEVEARWRELQPQAPGAMEVLSKAALVPWPLLPDELERALATRLRELPDDARRAWAIDRALPVLAGELELPGDALEALLGELRQGARRTRKRHDLSSLEAARRAYSRRDLARAVRAYEAVTRESTLWPDALREQAWTLLLQGRPNEALGATVTLGAPYFPTVDHAEARLLEATVLLDRCRYDEARRKVEPVAGVEIPLIAEQEALELARTALASNAPPQGEAWKRAWTSPLVIRARDALGPALVAASAAPAVLDRRQAVAELTARLLARAALVELEVLRELKVRALSVRYEAFRGERGIVEQGVTLSTPQPVDPPALEDDEVAWSFDGTFWRDELGTYRYSAGDACPRRSER